MEEAEARTVTNKMMEDTEGASTTVLEEEATEVAIILEAIKEATLEEETKSNQIVSLSLF